MDWSPRTSEKINGIKTGSKNITNKKNRQRLSEQPNSKIHCNDVADSKN